MRGPEAIVFRIAYGVLFLTLALMTWAYMAQAESLKSFLSHQSSMSGGWTSPWAHPSCSFNQLCTCSNPGPDLGIVTCTDVPFGHVPLALNYSRMLTLSLTNNNLQVLDDKRLVGSGLRRLQINENNLHYMTNEALFGLEKLREFDVKSNSLTVIPSVAMRNLRKLELLDLSDNKIMEVKASDLEGLHSLVALSLADNIIHRIEEGTFSKLSTLKHLDLSNNKILLIEPKAFPPGKTFTTLSLASNQLQKIPFDSLSALSLVSLDLSDNIIEDTTDAVASAKISVTSINLSRNRITTIQPYALVNFKSISKISFAYNPIEEILDDAFKNPGIKELDLSNCLISDISPKAFRGLASTLTTLDLSYNLLSEMDLLLFEDLDSLQSLNLDENDRLDFSLEELTILSPFLRDLHELSVRGVRNSKYWVTQTHIREMEKLRSLNISDCGTTTLTSDLFNGSGPGLEEININRGRISGIKKNAFATVPGLKYLDLSHNRISSIDPLAFVDVGRTLFRLKMTSGLSGGLTSIPGKALEKLVVLKELDLSSNKLTSISEDSFNHGGEIEYLNFRFNKISSLSAKLFPSDKLSSLKRLLLGFNNILEIPPLAFHGLANLEYLELNENKIYKVSQRSFVHLNGLKILNLAGNKLTQIGDEAFQNLPQLQLLDLSHNLLTVINFDAFDTIGTLSLLSLDLSHNELSVLMTEAEQERQRQQGASKSGSISSLGDGSTRSNSSSGNGTTTTTPSPPPRISISSSTIEFVDISFNNISYISTDFFYPISNTLIDLDLNHNSLRNFTKGHLLGMNFLQRLDLAHNDLAAIDPDLFGSSPAIQILVLDHNRIEDIPGKLFEDCTKMRVLRMGDNDLRSLEPIVFDDTPMEILDLSGNKLKHFPEGAMSKVSGSLVNLDLNGNEIASLFNQLECLQGIRELKLAHNKIVFMADTAFDKLSSVLELDLSGNPLARLTTKMFENIRNTLISLNVSGVGLESLPDFNFSQLLTFDASNNNLVGIPIDFGENVPVLKSADFSGNQFLILPNFVSDVFPQLNEIRLGDNQIRNLRNDSFYRLSQLHSLDISDLPLESLQLGLLQPLHSLETLKIGPLSDGRVIGAILQAVPTIQHLYIKMDGTMTDLSFMQLPHKLSKITLSGPKFQKILNGTFMGLRNRELTLVIEDTGLTEVPSNILQGLGYANQLRLSFTGNNSALKKVGNPSLKYRKTALGPYLNDLDFDGKIRLVCSCDSGWIEGWLGQWMQRTCGVNSPLKNLVECEEMLDTLRGLECQDKGGSQLMDVFSDIDCGWESGAMSLVPKSHFYMFSLIFLSICVSFLFGGDVGGLRIGGIA